MLSVITSIHTVLSVLKKKKKCSRGVGCVNTRIPMMLSVITKKKKKREKSIHTVLAVLIHRYQ